MLLVEPDPYRRSVAEELGHDVVDVRRGGPAGLARGRGPEGAGAAVTFEVSGVQAGFDLAVSALGARGRLVAVGIHAEPRLVDMKRVFWKELQILGARVYDAHRLHRRGRPPRAAGRSRWTRWSRGPTRWPTRPLAFESLAQGGRVMKVLVDCQAGRTRTTPAGAPIGLPGFDLRGRLAVVTGARRGLGLAIATALASAGADIVGVSASLESTGSAVQADVEGLGRTFEGHRVDFADRVAVAALADRLVDGRPVDILVNNAGTIERAPAVEHTDASWDRVIEVDLSSQFVLTREVGRQMVARGAGKIIFTASMLSYQGGVNVRELHGRQECHRGHDPGARERVGAARRERERDRARLLRHRQHRRRCGEDPSAIASDPRAHPGRSLGSRRTTSAAPRSSWPAGRRTTCTAPSWPSTEGGSVGDRRRRVPRRAPAACRWSSIDRAERALPLAEP